MFNFLFNRKKFNKDLAQSVVSEAETYLQDLSNNQTNQFNEIKEVLNHLCEKMNKIENRLAEKEMRDKHDYGHLKYKIGELQSDLIFDNPKVKKNQQ